MGFTGDNKPSHVRRRWTIRRPRQQFILLTKLCENNDSNLDEGINMQPYCFVADTNSMPFVIDDTGANRIIVTNIQLLKNFEPINGTVKGVDGAKGRSAWGWDLKAKNIYPMRCMKRSVDFMYSNKRKICRRRYTWRNSRTS